MGMSQKKYLPGQVVQLFLFFLSLNMNFDFFSPLRRAEVETVCLVRVVEVVGLVKMGHVLT